jgi:hypothetical protein
MRVRSSRSDEPDHSQPRKFIQSEPATTVKEWPPCAGDFRLCFFFTIFAPSVFAALAVKSFCSQDAHVGTAASAVQSSEARLNRHKNKGQWGNHPTTPKQNQSAQQCLTAAAAEPSPHPVVDPAGAPASVAHAQPGLRQTSFAGSNPVPRESAYW